MAIIIAFVLTAAGFTQNYSDSCAVPCTTPNLMNVHIGNEARKLLNHAGMEMESRHSTQTEQKKSQNLMFFIQTSVFREIKKWLVLQNRTNSNENRRTDAFRLVLFGVNREKERERGISVSLIFCFTSKKKRVKHEVDALHTNRAGEKALCF